MSQVPEQTPGQAITDPLSDAGNAYKAGNYEKAADLFRLLADQDHASAQNNLGVGFRMKKISTKIIVFLLFAVAAAWIGKQSGSELAASKVRLNATEQGVPAGFLGVGWLATRDEVHAKRPNVVTEQQDMLSEGTALYARPAKITYVFSNGNLVKFFIFTFTDNSDENTFALTRTQLAQNYGAFPKSTTTTDEYGLGQCATRDMKSFAIHHCLRNLGGIVREQVIFTR